MNNLLKTYKEIPHDFILKGQNWYCKANRFAERLSNVYNIDFSKVCGVISALSPACNWSKNKQDAESLIICYVVGGDYTRLNFSTYGQNVVKAWEILTDLGRQTETFFNPKTGAKTYNFYFNILDPNSKEFVTIDRHAIAIYEGRNGKSGGKSLSPKQYSIIADAYKKVAKKLGLYPNELQAILWEYHVHNSMTENRLN